MWPCRLLDSDELNVEREEEVYAAVIKWIRADLHSRKSDLLHIALVTISFPVYHFHVQALPARATEVCPPLFARTKVPGD